MKGRIGCLAAVVVAAVLAGVAGLVGWTAVASSREEALRHQIVAERIFDELERELTALLEAEERRSFLEYRYYYVPQGQTGSAGALVRSPLADPPTDPVVLGHFQIDPDGEVYPPFVPRGNELELARSEGRDAESHAGLAAQIRATLNPLPLGEAPTPAPAVAATPAPNMYESAVQSLNRGSMQRSRRQTREIPSKQQNIQGWKSSEVEIQQLATVAAPAEGRQQVMGVGDENVNVLLSPMRARLSAEGLLVLHRSVRVDAEATRQGVVLRLEALTQKLSAAVPEELAPFVALAWSAGGRPLHPSSSRAHRFSHRFGEPFADLEATAHLATIPAQRVPVRWVPVALSVLLAVGILAALGAFLVLVSSELEVSRRRSDFVAAVSHELKTPLTAIRMYAEMLRDGMVGSPEQAARYHQTICSESERLSRLIGNVLELARLQKGGEPLPLSPLELGEVVEATRALLAPQTAEAGGEISAEIPPGLCVEAERDALSGVLIALLENALKFSAARPQAEGPRVEISARTEGGMVCLTVRDHGPGVPRRQLRRIFEPFYRGERELTRRTRGTGIGLALVAGLASRLGGRVSARNHPQGGLEVSIRLRRAEQREASAAS